MTRINTMAQVEIPSRVASVWAESAGTTGQQIDLIFWSLLGLTGLMIVAICFLIIVFSVKYRAGVQTVRASTSETSWLAEATWIGIPFVMFLIIFAWAASVYGKVRYAPLDARTVYVVGKQWMWKVEHPQGRTEINELHVPVGEPIKLVMTSQDVIHSFYVPAFRIKQDVLPGRYTTLWFEATQPGRYHLFCAEYCGTDHAKMTGRVTVMQPADYQRWLDEEPLLVGLARGMPGRADTGLGVQRRGPFFAHNCHTCHWPNAPVQAPSLVGLFGNEVKLADGRTVIADEEYIRRSIMEPNADIVAGYSSPSLMPSFRDQVTQRDMILLIEFVKDLEDGWPQEVMP